MAQGSATDHTEIYLSGDGTVRLDVHRDTETVWLSQQQMSELFQTSRENIAMHLRNVYDEAELSLEATRKDFLQVRAEGTRVVRRKITHYSLDAIISVGYRVKSTVATQFRIWATQRLKEHLLRGYTINENRLEQLGSIVTILARSSDELVSGVAEVLAGYLPSLQTLRDYDEGTIAPAPGTAPHWTLGYDEVREIIDRVRAEFPHDTLFGVERGDSLRGIIGTIYQGFAGQELYPTVQNKAANLLYMMVKDHPLTDGNKRSAAALFITFLVRNGVLHDSMGRVRVSNNTLAAITLMVAMSDPKEKDLMISLVTSMLSGSVA